MSSYDDWESAADSFDTLVLPHIHALPPPKANWDDEEEDLELLSAAAPITKSGLHSQTKNPAPSPPKVAPTKAAQERKAQENADLRIAAEMLGGDGALLAPADVATAGTLVDAAAFGSYGTTVCDHLHGLTTAKVPAKHLMSFYKAVIADAAKHLEPADLQLLGQAVDAARNEKLRLAKAAKGKPAKTAAGVKVRLGREDDNMDEYCGVGSFSNE